MEGPIGTDFENVRHICSTCGDNYGETVALQIISQYSHMAVSVPGLIWTRRDEPLMCHCQKTPLGEDVKTSWQ